MTELQIALAASLVFLTVGWLAGHRYGYERGRAYGWQEGYFGKVHDDKMRRDHFGRFRAKNAPERLS